MVGDPQSKNPRQFNCREYIWETFEQMSQELDVTLDYLINESMRQYARGRERGGPMIEQAEQPERLSAGMGGFRPPMPGMGQPQRSAMPGMAQQQQPMQQQPMQQRPAVPGQPAQRLPSMSGGGQMGQQQRPGMPTNQPQPQGRPGMPPPPQQQPMQRPGMPGMPQAPQPPAPQAPPPVGPGRSLEPA